MGDNEQNYESENVEHVSGAYVSDRVLVFVDGATVSDRTLRITS